MKKLLLLLSAFVLLFAISLVVTSCGHKISQEAEYIEFCETDSIVIGYEYAFLFQDSIPMSYKVFNPAYPGLSSKDGNFVYADTSDLSTLRGYWICVQQLDRGVPKVPKLSNKLKITLEADWKGFVKWRDGK